MLGFFAIVLVSLSVYSYALVDPNFTLVNSPIWEVFRNLLVPLGYYHRDWSFAIYVGLIALLFGFSWYFVKRRTNPVKLAFFIALCLLISYPFLSHDFFNYLFDAKILTFYGKNPYLFRALDFPDDPWIRFMHWTHRTYPYGPTFLLLTLIASVLSFGKLALDYLLFKILFLGFYLLSVYFLNRINKVAALLFATSPLVLIEGLVNNHNDLIGVSLAIVSFYYVGQKSTRLWGYLFGLFSIGVKYFTIVFVPIIFGKKSWAWLSLGLIVGVLSYTYTKLGIHPWYFLNLLVLLVYVRHNLWSLQLLSFGLLMSYYPYIRHGGWDLAWKVELKEMIIFGSVFAAFLVFVFEIKALSLLRLSQKQLANLFNKAPLSKEKNRRSIAKKADRS